MMPVMPLLLVKISAHLRAKMPHPLRNLFGGVHAVNGTVAVAVFRKKGRHNLVSVRKRRYGQKQYVAGSIKCLDIMVWILLQKPDNLHEDICKQRAVIFGECFVQVFPEYGNIKTLWLFEFMTLVSQMSAVSQLSTIFEKDIRAA